MKIKRLEIKGFKSFPDKTVLEFKPGITLIVGPNGCGKSNVVEAIRWVIGEQRARILRGQKMGDVIFNGSESRKPVGMADVQMILSNTEGLAPPSMSDYDEIMIGRRLFRDGESQYEINNIPCRLSDITDLFLDTGVGRNSYAVIEQGRVEMVVASKPEDRRVLIEEAAGINRYKSRREEALKKLEQTSRNLERIKDVIAEVKSQSASLRRHAIKAERYRKLQDRLRELDVALQAYRCHDALEQYSRSRNELEKTRSVLLKQESQFASLQARLETERVQALNVDKSLKDLFEARHMTDIALTSVRGVIETDRGAVRHLLDRLKKIEEQKKEYEEKSRKTRLLLKELEQDRSTIQFELHTAAEELKNAVSESHRIDEERSRKVELLEGFRNDMFQNLQEAAQQRNVREGLIKRVKEIETKLHKVTEESESATATLADARVSTALLAQTLAEIEGLRIVHSHRKGELSETRRETVHLITELRNNLGSMEKHLAATKARIDSLEEMRRNFVGYDQSVRFLMNNQKPVDRQSLLGPLAELIEAPPEYEKALSAVLGQRLGNLVVPSTYDGFQAVNRLRQAGAGRATFIPITPRCGVELDEQCVVEGPTPLKDVVHFRKGFETLGDFLLAGYFVVGDIEQALEIWQRNGIQVDLVSMEGDLLNRFGEITGGSWDKKPDEIFVKRREIVELHQQRESLDKEVLACRVSLQEQEKMLQEVSSEIDHTDTVINDLNLKEVRSRSEHDRAGSRISSAERKLEVLRLEREQLDKEQGEITQDLGQSEASITLLENRRIELEELLKAAKMELEELEGEVEEKSRNSGQIRVRVAQLEERWRSRERELRSVEDTMQQIEEHVSGLNDETSLSTVDADRISNELIDAQAREKGLLLEHETQGRQITALKKESEDLSVCVKSLEEETTTCATAMKEVRESGHSLEMELVRLEQMVEGLVEKTLERYHLDPRTVSCQDSSPDQNEISEIRAKLESMGEVNFGAIAESRQAEERLSFLKEQEQDLKKSVDSLFDTINKINKTTRELFQAAFNNINEKFREIFQFLFRGGEAYLELTDEENFLETGVDIVARLPGKRRQNMSLLSGGEKALTAVAMIFSIFLTRPSPFCLLDEVDAPLDDSNIVRFNQMLRKLCDKTQFIIITHNKQSMEAADSLYGVTMEEPGVSTVVSVVFAE